MVGLTGIAELVTNNPELGDGSALGIVRDASVLIQRTENGPIIRSIGADMLEVQRHSDPIDLEGRAVVPGFVDSHTHLIFDGDRSAEFAARMQGKSYDGGGIATTVDATRNATDDQLRSLARHRVAEMHRQGTSTVEIKSGYGLTVDDEVRCLRIAQEFTAETTFLGGHVVPSEFADNRSAYVDLVAGEMVRACAPYARWVDVFCEPGSSHAFDEDEARTILTAGMDLGLLPRVHAGQLGLGPGVQLAVAVGAASVDHCTYLSDADIEALAASDTVATLLPGVEFSTRSPYPDGGSLLDRGVTIALATDCNPGTCYSSSIPFCIALAVREMNLTPGQALWAATAGAARSLRRDDLGRLFVGGPADLTLLEAPSHLHLAYRPGVPIARAFSLPH